MDEVLPYELPRDVRNPFRVVLGSVLRLIYLPSGFNNLFDIFVVPGFWFNISFLILYFVRNSLPILSGEFVGILGGITAFFVFLSFSRGRDKNRGGKELYREINNNLSSLSLMVTGLCSNNGIKSNSLVYLQELKVLLVWYVYSIKNSFRGVIKIEKLPWYKKNQKLAEELSLFEKPSVSSPMARENITIYTFNRRKLPIKSLYDNSSFVLDKMYQLILVRLDNIIKKNELSPESRIIFYNPVNTVNTLIGKISNSSFIKSERGVLEIIFVLISFYCIILGPFLIQRFTIWVAFAFYNYLFYIIAGCVLYSRKISNPFDDPENNVFLQDKGTVGEDANTTVHAIKTSFDHAFKSKS